MDAWRARFQAANPDLTINYDPVGSGGGRTQFLDGAVAWAGSDAALSRRRVRDRRRPLCGADGAIHLPVYISPDRGRVQPRRHHVAQHGRRRRIAQIFDGKITKWNDPAIAADERRR